MTGVFGAAEDFLHDMRHGMRTMRKSAVFSSIAVITLGIGIGANTAAFSLLEAWVWHPVHLPQPNQLVVVSTLDRITGARGGTSPADFLAWRSQNAMFADISAWSSVQHSISIAAARDRVPGVRVSANFFRMLKADLALGRGFLPEEEEPGRSRVMVLSNAFWRTRFAGDANVIGRTLRIDGEEYEVVGVLSADFDLPLMGSVSLWTPLALEPSVQIDRRTRSLGVIGRLKMAAAPASAEAGLNTIAATLAREYPETNRNARASVRSLQQQIAENSGRQGLILLFGIVACLLSMACVNVSNMSLARTIERRRDIAVRLALGASRSRIVRQVLTENLLLFVVAGVAAAVLARATVAWIIALIPGEVRGYLPHYGVVPLSPTVFLYALGVAIFTSTVFGAFPALQTSRVDVSGALKEDGRRGSEGPRGRRMRNALIAGQIGLAMVILVVAGLMTRTILNVFRIHPGFDASEVLATEVVLSQQAYGTATAERQFAERVLAHASGLGGLPSVGISDTIPFGSSGPERRDFVLVERPLPSEEAAPSGISIAASPGFFSALRIGLVTGRVISAWDGPEAPPVAVINETLARRHFPQSNPIGAHLRWSDGAAPSLTIVGVVKDIKLTDLAESSEPQIYLAFAQFPSRRIGVMARTSDRGRSAASDALRAAILAADRDLGIGPIRSLQSGIDDHEAGNRLFVVLVGSFAVLALLLAGLGLYSVMARAIASRTQEIGIRMALGADGRSVVVMVMRDGLRVAAAGGLLGILLALGVGRLLSGVLFGVAPHDPKSFMVAFLTLAAATVLACLVPSIRAARLNPVHALRRI